MTVTDIFKFRNVFTVYGECNGRDKLKQGTVKDENGKEYSFSIPLTKELIFDDSKIELQLLGEDIDLEALKGQKLIQ